MWGGTPGIPSPPWLRMGGAPADTNALGQRTLTAHYVYGSDAGALYHQRRSTRTVVASGRVVVDVE